MGDTFKAVLVEQHDSTISAAIKDVERADLPEGDVLVKVAYSGLNYKDGLAITGRNKVVRSYPMVPGIDFSGTVAESASPRYHAGDRVLLTGWGVGERHWGGMAQLARVKSEWLVPVSEHLDLKMAMAIGTAGFTAMLAVMALEEHDMRPDGREVLVTGAGGGVGGLAVALLAALGHTVVAETGRTELHDYLKSLGAHEIIARSVLEESSGPLGSARWGGAIDAAGGAMLAGALRTLAYGASVAACGNAAGFDVQTTVLPFILRAVNVLGIDSLPTPYARRVAAWERLEREMPPSALERITQVFPLGDALDLAQTILRGQTRGRVVLDVNA